MGFELERDYTRGDICRILGLPDDTHAVITDMRKVFAIVVLKNGHHPSGKKYKNDLNTAAKTFQLHGEDDRRGRLLKNASAEVPLFFSHRSDGHYRFEGWVRFQKSENWEGEPFYYFALSREPQKGTSSG